MLESFAGFAGGGPALSSPGTSAGNGSAAVLPAAALTSPGARWRRYRPGDRRDADSGHRDGHLMRVRTGGAYCDACPVRLDRAETNVVRI